ncbi:heavy metal translocating P-type ATPase [Bacillus songklensis]|uniref:Cd(2+)-exporting ATPase n=1 Tax=Bacillus songklensis TaxID=1069116 RepID=A0ABV8B6M1_9BACI
MEQELEKHVYRIQGFTCANCAKKFETNVRELDGVRDAAVNFGASKLTVYGHTTIEELEKAGAFEQLKLVPDGQKAEEVKIPSWKKHGNVIISALFVALGWAFLSVFGEEHFFTVGAFALAIIIGGYRVFTAGLKNLVRFQFDMRTLMTVAIIGAAAIGEWSEGATVVILFAISEVLESYSMDKARQSIRSLMEIAPKQALIRRNGEEFSIPVEDIAIDDVMIVKPGQKIAMDGVVIKGISTVNQAAITGESVPVEKASDDEVFAGTLNEEGLLEVRVTKRVEDTTISKIIHLVEEAQGERAPSQAFVDRFAKYYTPVIIFIALVVAIVPPLLFGADWGKWIYQGLAILVVGCPCALVISTPVAIVTAIGNAARHGVLIKGGIHLEETGAIEAIAFDKTGTLTKGTPEVTDLIVYTNEEQALRIAAVLENNSQHPLASAIMKKAEESNVFIGNVTVKEFHSVTGKGIKGQIDGKEYAVGSPGMFRQWNENLMTGEINQTIERLQHEGKTVMVVGTEERIESLIAVADTIRENSPSVLEKLRKLNIRRIIMLTGDNEQTARGIGKQIGVQEVKAELLPGDKLRYIKQLRRQHKHVAMVGDGVNDAPALAAATVGVAMGGAGTDTALETADVVLMGDDLRKLPFTISLSRKALAIIKQNISFSLMIKLIALLLVIPGWLTLWIAIFADMGATLIVTLNGLRLLKVKG